MPHHPYAQHGLADDMQVCSQEELDAMAAELDRIFERERRGLKRRERWQRRWWAVRRWLGV